MVFKQAYMNETLTYDDIALVPRLLSKISSRDEVSIDTTFMGLELESPILSAPMKTVTGPYMAQTLGLLGCLGVMARTSSHEQDVINFKNCNKSGVEPVVSVGLKGITEQITSYMEAGASRFCIDVANGFNENVAEVIQYIRNEIPGGDNLWLMAGNVGSVQGYEYLAQLDIDAVRVGIGNGSLCSTSIATGIGMGQVSLLREITLRRRQLIGKSPAVIADGGIKEPGHVAKAIALGADVVMIGTLFAGCAESPGEVVEKDGLKFKTHAGEASKHSKGNNRYVEGVSTLVPLKGSVGDILKELDDGLKSSMAYMGCRTIKEFNNLPDDCFVKLSSNARAERLPITMR